MQMMPARVQSERSRFQWSGRFTTVSTGSRSRIPFWLTPPFSFWQFQTCCENPKTMSDRRTRIWWRASGTFRTYRGRSSLVEGSSATVLSIRTSLRIFGEVSVSLCRSLFRQDDLVLFSQIGLQQTVQHRLVLWLEDLQPGRISCLVNLQKLCELLEDSWTLAGSVNMLTDISKYYLYIRVSPCPFGQTIHLCRHLIHDRKCSSCAVPVMEGYNNLHFDRRWK